MRVSISHSGVSICHWMPKALEHLLKGFGFCMLRVLWLETASYEIIKTLFLQKSILVDFAKILRNDFKLMLDKSLHVSRRCPLPYLSYGKKIQSGGGRIFVLQPTHGCLKPRLRTLAAWGTMAMTSMALFLGQILDLLIKFHLESWRHTIGNDVNYSLYDLYVRTPRKNKLHLFSVILITRPGCVYHLSTAVKCPNQHYPRGRAAHTLTPLAWSPDARCRLSGSSSYLSWS